MKQDKCTPSNDDQSEAGFVMISALWLMALIGLVVAIASTNFAYSSKLSQARLDRSKNYFSSLGVATLFADQLLQIKERGALAANVDFSGLFRCLYRGEIHVWFAMFDHDGLIDLNAASAKLIQLGFTAAGFPNIQAKFLSERVVDYRDRDSATAGGELESSFYSSIGSVYLPKNSQFLSIFELDQLPFEKRFDFVSLSRIFTIKTGLDGIDISKATGVLRVLMSQGIQVGIFNRKSRERFYSIDTVIYRGRVVANSVPAFRTISFLDVSSARARGFKLFAPWSVPINDDLPMEHASNINVENMQPPSCSNILVG